MDIEFTNPVASYGMVDRWYDVKFLPRKDEYVRLYGDLYIVVYVEWQNSEKVKILVSKYVKETT